MGSAWGAVQGAVTSVAASIVLRNTGVKTAAIQKLQKEIAEQNDEIGKILEQADFLLRVYASPTQAKLCELMSRLIRLQTKRSAWLVDQVGKVAKEVDILTEQNELLNEQNELLNELVERLRK